MSKFRELYPRYIRILVGNFTVQIWFRNETPYRISGIIEGTTLKSAIDDDYHSCPLIDTGGIASRFAYQQEVYISAHLVDPVK